MESSKSAAALKKQQSGSKPVKANKANTSSQKVKKVQPKTGSTNQTRDKMPAFWRFTGKQRDFNLAARTLSRLLEENFGEEASISRFEKMLSSLPSLSNEEKSQIFLSKEIMTAYDIYQKAKIRRDDERQSFRSKGITTSVESGIKQAMEIISIASQSSSSSGDTSLQEKEEIKEN